MTSFIKTVTLALHRKIPHRHISLNLCNVCKDMFVSFHECVFSHHYGIGDGEGI